MRGERSNLQHPHNDTLSLYVRIKSMSINKFRRPLRRLIYTISQYIKNELTVYYLVFYWRIFQYFILKRCCIKMLLMTSAWIWTNNHDWHPKSPDHLYHKCHKWNSTELLVVKREAPLGTWSKPRQGRKTSSWAVAGPGSKPYCVWHVTGERSGSRAMLTQDPVRLGRKTNQSSQMGKCSPNYSNDIWKKNNGKNNFGWLHSFFRP